MQGCVYSCIKYFNPLVLMSKKLINNSKYKRRLSICVDLEENE